MYNGRCIKARTSHEQSDTVSRCRGLITSMTNFLFTKHMDATRSRALSRSRAAWVCRKTASSLQFTPARRRATRFRWRSEEMSCRVVPPHTIIQYLPFPRLPRCPDPSYWAGVCCSSDCIATKQTRQPILSDCVCWQAYQSTRVRTMSCLRT